MAAGPEHLGSGGGSGFLGSFVVRDAAEHIPTSIVRPAQIVGDAETGFVATFNTLYYPLKLYLKGQLPVIPVSASQKLNMVPVDYVSRIVVRALLDSNKAWRMPHGDIMSIMIKMADASIGSYDGRALDKPLIDSDWETIARAVDVSYEVLEAMSVSRASRRRARDSAFKASGREPRYPRLNLTRRRIRRRGVRGRRKPIG